MPGAFDLFVIFAEMRTGSNLLERYLNQVPGLCCQGEAFNPSFIGTPDRDSLLGVTQRQRDACPDILLNAIRDMPSDLGGFRYFHDHDPRILKKVLTDPRCAKIILTRNPLDSYISLKIARQTDQWTLTEVLHRKPGKARFEMYEFEQRLYAVQRFHTEIQQSLRCSGQTAFCLGYDDLRDGRVLAGLAKWLGKAAGPRMFRVTLKPQNPEPLLCKVENHAEMTAALRDMDPFDLTRLPCFEPRRGPAVPSFVACAHPALLYMPIGPEPEPRVTRWMAALDPTGAAPVTGVTRTRLHDWMQAHPGHRKFTVLRHPLIRAHDVFCDHILAPGTSMSGRFAQVRQQLALFSKTAPLLSNKADFGADVATHRAAFVAFLRFLKANLAGQTNLRVDAHWASQTTQLAGLSAFCSPDQVLRDDELTEALSDVAKRCDVTPPREGISPPHRHARLLAQIYDPRLERLCRQAYARDYLMFGFSDFEPAK